MRKNIDRGAPSEQNKPTHSVIQPSRRPKRSSVLAAAVVGFSVVGFGTISADATNKTWTGGTSITWGTAANWNPGGTAPATTDVALFSSSTTVTNQPTLAGSAAVGGIWDTGDGTGTSTYEISFNTKNLTLDATTVNGNATTGIEVDSGNALVMDGGGSASSNEYMSVGAVQSWLINGTLTFQNFGNVALTLPNALTIQGSGTTTIANKMNGSGALTVDGTGVVSLAGSGTTDTYTGQLTIESGTLKINAANNQSGNGQLGASSNTNTIVMGGAGTTGTLEYAGTSNNGSNRSINLATNGTGAVQVDTSSATLTLNGAISGSGSLSMNGPGNLLLSGTNYTYSGGTAVNSGTLIVGNASGSATGTGNVTMNGGTLASSVATAAISGNVVDGATSAYTIAPGGIGTVGTLTLGGLTTSSLGTLNFDLGTGAGPEISSGDLLVLGSGTVSIGSGTNLSFGGTAAAGDDYRLIGDQSSGSVVDAIPLNNFNLPSAPAGLTWSLNNTVDVGYIDLVVATSGPPSLTWNNAGGNNLWDTSSDNWNNGSGNALYADPDTVTFNDNNPSSTPANYAVTLNGTVHPGGITVNSAGSYTISGTGSIAGTGSLTQSGTGTLVLDTANSYSGGTNVSNGKLIIDRISSTTSALPTGALSITGGIVQLAGNVTQGSQPTSTPASNVNITSLAISGTGTLDITNDHIIIDYTPGNDPIASIAAWIKSGYNSGTWTGNGIMSTTAQTNASYGIGYADAADAGNPAGLSSGQIEIAYTLLGDANLDYKVNGDDFTLMAANFNDLVSAGWDKGDFNYSNTVNGDDFVLLANNFNQFASQSAVAAADLQALDSFAAANGISLSNVSSVPEPASMALLTLGTIGVLARRRA